VRKAGKKSMGSSMGRLRDRGFSGMGYLGTCFWVGCGWGRRGVIGIEGHIGTAAMSRAGGRGLGITRYIESCNSGQINCRMPHYLYAYFSTHLPNPQGRPMRAKWIL